MAASSVGSPTDSLTSLSLIAGHPVGPVGPAGFRDRSVTFALPLLPALVRQVTTPFRAP